MYTDKKFGAPEAFFFLPVDFREVLLVVSLANNHKGGSEEEGEGKQEEEGWVGGLGFTLMSRIPHFLLHAD